MKEARLKSNINKIYLAGTNITLTSNSFDLYDNGVISSATRNSNEVFSELTGTAPFFITGSNQYNFTLYAAKHTRSTSYADDIANNHYNTSTDDLGNVLQLRLGGMLTHPTAGVFTINENLYYCPAVYPPNINVSRIAAIHKNSATNYSGIFQNAQINELSPSKANKTTPHSASEIIGYSPLYSPVIFKYLYSSYTIEEGLSNVNFSVDYIAANVNQSSGISNVKMTAVRQSDSAVSNFSVSTPSLKTEGSIPMTLTAGNYTVTPSFIQNSVPYSLSSYSVSVTPAPANISSFSITSYSAITHNMGLSATATTGKTYYIQYTTYWEKPFEYPVTTYTYSGSLNDWIMTAGSNTKTVNIPQTRPPEINGNLDYMIVRILMELKTYSGNTVAYATREL